jgi:hypothetical protein
VIPMGENLSGRQNTFEPPAASLNSLALIPSESISK